MRAYAVSFLLWLTLLAGCAMPARSRAVEQLRPVETMGCDADREFVTVSASSGGEVPMAAAARGGSIPQAMENLRRWSDAQELFFAHVRYVVAGEAFARAGLGELLDYFARSTQTSLEIPLVVVRGGTARELVTAPAGPDREVTVLLASMQRDAEQTGTARCFTLREIARRLSRSGAVLCCAVEARRGGENLPGQDSPAILCAGYAVLKDAVLAGFLDPDAALGADLIMDLAGQANYVLSWGGGTATVTLLKSETELTAARDADGEVSLLATTRIRAGVLSSDGADMADPIVRRGLAKALAHAAASQEEAALDASRALNADFLELRRAVGKAFATDVAGEAVSLRALRCRVRVEAELERSYDLDGGGAVYG